MKKKYISPQCISNTLAPELLTVASTFSTDGDSQTISISENEVDEFTSRRSIWADESDGEDF